MLIALAKLQTNPQVQDKTILVPGVSKVVRIQQRERNMFVISAYLAVAYFGLAFGIDREYLLNVSDACYQHSNDVISDVYGIMSITECSSVCAMDNCRALLFSGNTQRCITCTQTQTKTPGCGWKYAETNTTRSRVTCDVPGYSYDPSKDSCVVYCTSYGTTFETFPGYVITGFNNDRIGKMSRTNCMDACVAATEFVCRSADFDPANGACNLSEETAQTKPLSYGRHEDNEYLHRLCA